MILALDVAGRVGWAVGSAGSSPIWGAQEIAIPNAAPGAIFAHYDAWLRYMLHTHNPNHVFAEAPFVGRFPAVAMRLGGYKAITQYRCYIDDRRLHPFVPPREITKHFVGAYKGNKKVATVARCRELGFDVGGDDDAADALALWHYACEKILI